MSKDILIESLSTPDKLGYNDKIVIVSDNESIFHCQCSTCPNPYRIKDKMPWDKCFGWIAPTTKEKPYSWTCISTTNYKKCLYIGQMPTRNFDVNNKAFFAVGVLVHKGYSASWRGSTACITIPPYIWDTFIANFTLGEKGLLYISDFLEKPKPVA